MVSNINNINLDLIALYRDNYLNQFHIRQMAKLIRKSHVSLLPHLKMFEENKILISKEVGRSKVYSLNLNNNQAREFLSLAEKNKSIELLNNEIFIRKIYEEFIGLDLSGSLILFGSYASKAHTQESDIDLFYLGDLKESENKKIKNLGKIYNKKVHLISMNLKQFREQLSNQGTLAKEIINNHIILYNHDIFVNEVWRYYYERKER
jgi:predicted nucleotidyltransferase/DNA-binding transcriptional ArsR family regulator